MPGKEIGHFRLCPFSQALLPGCASHTNLTLVGNFSIPMPFSPHPSPLAPLLPGAHPSERCCGVASGTSKKKSCFGKALLPLVVAISGEPSGGCLGHLPLGNGPAYLARDWASPYLLTLACLTPGLGVTLKSCLGVMSPPGVQHGQEKNLDPPLYPIYLAEDQRGRANGRGSGSCLWCCPSAQTQSCPP